MDKLKECALSFQNLFDKEYFITAGSKNRTIEFMLCFAKEHFHHLMGLHKLKDIQKARGNKCKIFDSIINDGLTYYEISKSSFFDEIKDRFIYFSQLENMLDSNDMVIKFNNHIVKGTSIPAKYIITAEKDNGIIHLFVDILDNEIKYYGRSFFYRMDDTYIKGQQRFTVLRKHKINTYNNEVAILIDKIKN